MDSKRAGVSQLWGIDMACKFHGSAVHCFDGVQNFSADHGNIDFAGDYGSIGYFAMI